MRDGHNACLASKLLGGTIFSSGISSGKAEEKPRNAEKTGRILSPCGNCRQVFSDYMPDGFVIVGDKDKLFKVRAKELIPYSYHAQY